MRFCNLLFFNYSVFNLGVRDGAHGAFTERGNGGVINFG